MKVSKSKKNIQNTRKKDCYCLKKSTPPSNHIILINHAHLAALESAVEIREQRQSQHKDKIKRKKDALVRTRKIRNNNFNELKHFNQIEAEHLQTWHRDTRALRVHKDWLTSLIAQSNLIVVVGKSKAECIWVLRTGTTVLGFLPSATEHIIFVYDYIPNLEEMSFTTRPQKLKLTIVAKNGHHIRR